MSIIYEAQSGVCRYFLQKFAFLSTHVHKQRLKLSTTSIAYFVAIILVRRLLQNAFPPLVCTAFYRVWRQHNLLSVSLSLSLSFSFARTHLPRTCVEQKYDRGTEATGGRSTRTRRTSHPQMPSSFTDGIAVSGSGLSATAAVDANGTEANEQNGAAGGGRKQAD